MHVTFARTAPRRYGVFVDRADYPPVEMNPAPSYCDDLPHDFVHFVVEEELDMIRGVFGQLAAGGDAGTFRIVQAGRDAREMARARRKQRKRGQRLSDDGSAEAQFSERAATICHQEWFKRFPNRERMAEVGELDAFVRQVRAECSPMELDALSDVVVERICHRLEALSARWSEIGVGESITLEWSPRPSGSMRRSG